MHGGNPWEKTERNSAAFFCKIVLKKLDLLNKQRDKDVETICTTDLWNSKDWRVVFDKEKTSQHFKARKPDLEIVERNVTKYKHTLNTKYNKGCFAKTAHDT